MCGQCEAVLENFVLAAPLVSARSRQGGNASTGASQCKYFAFRLAI